MTESIAIAILAGGQSRRMGQDKAQLKLGDTTLLERIIDVAHQVSETVAVVGRAGGRADTRWLKDDTPGLGPLGGLKTALTDLQQPLILLACDMPRVDADALQWLLACARNADAPLGLTTMRDAQIEPLFSLYRPALLPGINAQIATGRLSLRRLIKGHHFRAVEAPEAIAKKLVNINTPEDLAALNRSS